MLIFLSSIPCVLYLYIAKSCWLLWSECSVHVSDGFPKKKFGWGVGGWGELYSIFFGIFWICLTSQIPLVASSLCWSPFRLRGRGKRVVTWLSDIHTMWWFITDRRFVTTEHRLIYGTHATAPAGLSRSDLIQTFKLLTGKENVDHEFF